MKLQPCLGALFGLLTLVACNTFELGIKPKASPTLPTPVALPATVTAFPSPPPATLPLPTFTPPPSPSETPPTPLGTDELDLIQVTVPVSSIVLRTGPSTVHSALALYPQGSLVTLLGKAAGDEWVQVRTADNKAGWMAVTFLNNPDLTQLPVIRPDNSLMVTGKILYTDGTPVGDRFGLAVWQGDLRTDAYSQLDGTFYAYLPLESAGQWTVGVVGLGPKNLCSWPTTPEYLLIEVPQTQTVVFTCQLPQPKPR